MIGIVKFKSKEYYAVDLGGPHLATLPILAFEGATLRNRPNLQTNSVVYARVSVANKDMEPEIDCIHPSTGKADGFGELKQGFMIDRCSLDLCRYLLTKNNALLNGLSSMFPFELAIGMNGRVWVNAGEPKQIVAIVNLIRAADGQQASKIPVLLKATRKFYKESE